MSNKIKDKKEDKETLMTREDYARMAAEVRNIDSILFALYSFKAAQKDIDHIEVDLSDEVLGYFKDESNSIDHKEFNHIYNPNERPPI